jgi:Flp pilus assembly CpaF family ATPase
MNEETLRHCVEIDRCNQRGGRMLSIVDLIDAGTMSPELAAYSLAAIGGGASFMVGALPGGAGKTTSHYRAISRKTRAICERCRHAPSC